MSLESWAENGWLRRQTTSSNDIKSLLALVKRSLEDSRVTAISNDTRFICAFSAALQAVTVALRASGYRAVEGRGHNEHTIDSLEFTSGATSATIQKLKTLSRKRNRANYDAADAVSDHELQAMIELATELSDQVKEWLEKNHPRLMK